MSACPVIIQVWFDGDKATDAICPPMWNGVSRRGEATGYKGMPYWQAPDGKGAVYRWSFDMVVCGDERWVVFGPFDGREAALSMLRAAFPLDFILGYLLINEHCAAYCGSLGRLDKSKPQSEFAFYREAWTDG